MFEVQWEVKIYQFGLIFVHETTICNINRFVLQECVDFTWRVSDCEELVVHIKINDGVSESSCHSGLGLTIEVKPIKAVPGWPTGSVFSSKPSLVSTCVNCAKKVVKVYLPCSWLMTPG